MGCVCPKPTALTPIDVTTCPEEIGQFQRFILCRAGVVRFDTVDPDVTGGSLPASIQGPLNYPTALAPWTILEALATNDAVIFTPLIGGDPTITPGTEITQGGGDNSTLNGEIYSNGFNPADGAARFDSLTSEQTRQLKLLRCEKLEVFFILDNGDILGERDTTNTDLWHGFPVKNFSIGGRSVQGTASRDGNGLTFQLDKDWDTKFEKQIPADFQALTVFS